MLHRVDYLCSNGPTRHAEAITNIGQGVPNIHSGAAAKATQGPGVAGQIGGYARAGADRALITQCHPALLFGGITLGV